MTLLSVEHLTIKFNTDEGRILAVDDVSFEVNAGRSSGSCWRIRIRKIDHREGHHASQRPQYRLWRRQQYKA